MNINGWNTIRVMLARNNRSQTWLAKELGFSRPAITYIKKGAFALKGTCLEKVCRILNATPSEKSELYSEVINARFFGTEKVKIEVIK